MLRRQLGPRLESWGRKAQDPGQRAPWLRLHRPLPGHIWRRSRSRRGDWGLGSAGADLGLGGRQVLAGVEGKEWEEREWKELEEDGGIGGDHLLF